jgi:type VI protein secretion system component VasK
MLLAANYPLLSIFWTMLEILGFVIFAFLIFMVVMDLFRSQDLSGWAKAAWLIFVLFVPLIGILCYLIVRGRSMQARTDQWRAEREYGTVTGPTAEAAGPQETRTDQLAKLAELRDRGVLSAQEFDREKARLLSTQ